MVIGRRNGKEAEKQQKKKKTERKTKSESEKMRGGDEKRWFESKRNMHKEREERK